MRLDRRLARIEAAVQGDDPIAEAALRELGRIFGLDEVQIAELKGAAAWQVDVVLALGAGEAPASPHLGTGWRGCQCGPCQDVARIVRAWIEGEEEARCRGNC